MCTCTCTVGKVYCMHTRIIQSHILLYMYVYKICGVHMCSTLMYHIIINTLLQQRAMVHMVHGVV
jgi:hypothetical protein